MKKEAKEFVKITIIGAGFVGSTTAYTLLVKGIAAEIILIDKDRNKAEGEAMDLRHGMSLAFPAKIIVGDYRDAAGSDIVVIAAGASQKPGQTRLDLVSTNLEIFKSIIPEISRHCPEAILIIATNPVDILTYAAWKISGFPSSRVIGSGTLLDSSRFRQALSAHCGIDVRNIHAYIAGEHGDSEVPLWSLANVGGVPIDQFCILAGNNCTFPDQDAIFREVRSAAYKIIADKGATYYGIGLALTRIIEAIIRDENSLLTISTLIQGQYGIYDVCLSIPTVVNGNGVANLLEMPLSIEERSALRKSADTIKGILEKIEPGTGILV